MEYLISIILIGFSALFSGLTLGFFTLDTHALKRRAQLGDKDAAAIYPLRKKGNQLLTTLLFGNVLVNTILSVYLGTIVSGVVASIAATSLIFVFGEIVPQAVMSRNAVFFGSKLAPIVRVLLVLFYPIAYPIAHLLDRLLGDEAPMVHSKIELMHIVSEHEDSAHSAIDADEERIIHGALLFSQKKVRDVMSPTKDVVAFSTATMLSPKTRHNIIESGFSRFPVYKDKIDNVVGILYTKDVLIEPHDIPVGEACELKFLSTSPNSYLDSVMQLMLTRKQHMCIVKGNDGEFLGVITLEDIIEEIIQYEIEDEDD